MAERLALTVKNILFGTKWVEFTERKQIHSIFMEINMTRRKKSPMQAYGTLCCSHQQKTI